MTTITLVEGVLHTIAGQFPTEYLVVGIECRSSESMTSTLNQQWHVMLS